MNTVSAFPGVAGQVPVQSRQAAPKAIYSESLAARSVSCDKWRMKSMGSGKKRIGSCVNVLQRTAIILPGITICIAARARIIAALVLVATLLSSCAARQGQPGELRNATWVASLAALPDGTPERECVRSSLQTQFALLAFRDGKFDDAHIKSAMLDELRNVRVREMRTADFAEWKKTHAPSSVADQHISRCLADSGHRLPRSDLMRRCFLATEPAALLSIYRKMERPIEQAVAAVTAQYKNEKALVNYADLGNRVYQLPAEAEDLRFREALLAGCLNGQE